MICHAEVYIISDRDDYEEASKVKEGGEELERLQQELERVKQQDRILAEIERRLVVMKKIAEYAARNKLSRGKVRELEEQMKEHKDAIQSLRNYLD